MLNKIPIWIKNTIKTFLLTPYLVVFWFQIIYIFIFNYKFTALIIIKGNNRRLDCVCPSQKRFIYFRKKYALLFLPKEHYASCLIKIGIYFVKDYVRNKSINIISDEKEDLKSWNFSLLWNHIGEIQGKFSNAILTIDDITSDQYNQPLRLSLPLIANNNQINTNCKFPHPIYIGRVFQNLNIDELKYDYLNLDKTECITTKTIEEFTLERNYSRLFFVKSIQKEFGDQFRLYGKGWDSYGLEYNRLGMLKSTRKKVYKNAGICVDFLSQHTNNCLYERTLDIFNNGSLVIQRKTFDSEIVYGEEYVNLLCWDTLEELFNIINLVMKHGIGYYKEAYESAIISISKYQSSRNFKCTQECLKRLNIEKDKSFKFNNLC
mgnify:CR=1 FL=1|tara:strand:- start:1437 stop:2567 length:1131 start_codon:yes stop_codon:yes gene_type:complete